MPLRGIATWDYTAHLAEFTASLHAQAARTPVVNPPSATEGNPHKSYLLYLAAAGVPLPTMRLLRAGDAVDEDDLRSTFQADRVVTQPASEPEGGG